MTTDTETETDAMLSEVLELSGRELDAAVAVELMGWRWLARIDDTLEKQRRCAIMPPLSGGWERWNFIPELWTDVTGSEAQYERFSDWAFSCSKHGKERHEVRGLPHFDTDRDAAHEVLTAIAQDHLITDWVDAFRQVAQPDKDLQRLFWAANGKETAGDFVVFTAAFACPATICRAALLAVRRKKERVL